MCLPGSMKFWPRVASVAVLCVVSLGIYISLPNEAFRLVLQQHHKIMLRSINGSSGMKKWDPLDTQEDPEMCSLTYLRAPHHANISTYDLYYNTQFNVKSNGEWEMTVPTPDHHRSSGPPRLNVILVPHSHNDPGWLKTVNQYYTDQTKHILNNMVRKLSQYPNMTFIWAETVFFSMWWNEIEDAVKVHVRRLIRRGQLEIALGGWVMPDEASSHYSAVIDQLIEGHQWLWENLNVRPMNSWSIDPFGYSSTMPYLWQKSGMSNMVVQRVHQAVKASLVKESSLEFYWRQMWDNSGSSDIFCHVMPFMLYSIKYTCGPNQFVCQNFDFRNIFEELSENRGSEITNENLKHSAEMLYHQYRAKAYYFRYNTILVPIGDDFRYDKEKEWDQQYENYEKLIQYLNSKPDWNMNVQWGTLQTYFQQVQKEHKKKTLLSRRKEFPVLSGDFFPYSDKDMAYWTGYYSTRPFDKSFSRDVQATLQAADILNTLQYAFHKRWGMSPEAKFSAQSSLLQQARRSVGLFLHHDAITGTAQSFVAEDYEKYLLKAYSQSQEVIKLAIQFLLSNGKVESPVVFHPETVRKSHVDLPEKQVISVQRSGTTVAFFNPLGQPRQQIVHLLVNTPMLEVVSSSNLTVPSQIGPVWSTELDASVLDNVFELTFLADIGPFAIASYIMYKKGFHRETVYTSSITVANIAHISGSVPKIFHLNKPEPKRISTIVVDNQVIQLTFDPTTGSLLEVMELATKAVTKLNISFQIYKSQGSGAYLFSPKGPATNLFSNIPIIKVSQGPLKTTVVVTFEAYITHTVTLYHHPSHLASAIFIDNTLNMDTLKDKELIVRLNTNIDNSDLSFFTDQNSFQFIRRRTNRSLPTEANYYPMTSAVVLEDHQARLTLLSAQPHGVSCLETGQMEVMLDRQLIYDDKRGLGEGITDIKPTISKFVIVVERKTSPSEPSAHHFTSLSLTSMTLSDMLQQPSIAYFTTVDSNVFLRNVPTVSASLPCDISAVNFRSLANGNLNYNGTSFILHRRGYDCSFPSYTLPCSPSDSSLTFEDLFKDFSLSSIHETTLTHTVVKRLLRITDRILIAPMELVSFHFQF